MSALRKERLPIADREKKLLIVVARIFARIDHEKSKLPRVGAAMEIVIRHRVAVIPARPGGRGE